MIYHEAQDEEQDDDLGGSAFFGSPDGPPDGFWLEDLALKWGSPYINHIKSAHTALAVKACQQLQEGALM